MKKLIIAAACAALAPVAFAQSAGDIIVRVRAVDLQSANSNSADLKATLDTVLASPGHEASINNKWLPEVDFTYFFTPNIAAELILTYPQKQSLSVNQGVGEIGTFKHLPPTLTAQYHFTGLPGFRPYVGVGVNYTNISDVQWNANVAGLNLNLKRNSFGLALQAGVDVPLTGNWMLNLDIKKVQIGTDVTSNDTKIGTFKVDPLLVGLGVGYKF